MHVRKESGGTTIAWRNVAYEWREDDSVLKVPDEFGAILLAIRGGGYSEVPEPEPAEVTEPGPAAEVTEPGPVAEITEGGDGKPARKGRGTPAAASG